MNLPFILITALVLVGCQDADQQVAAAKDSIETIASSFPTEDGSVLEARIVAPAKAERNGYGILMLGGGYGNDLDWSSPGFLDVQGKKMPVTISGKTHTDAPLIAKSLAQRGFVVMHWGTFKPPTPKSDVWPNVATMHSIKDLLRFSKSALAHFREQKLFADDKVILLGHSLGGVRAANIAAEDNQIDSLVLLAAAQLTRTSALDPGKNTNRAKANDFIRALDADGDGACSLTEYSVWAEKPANSNHPLALESFERLDFFGDGKLVGWEVSAGFARDDRSKVDFNKDSKKFDSSGLRWTEDILKEKPIETLIVYGVLDNSQSHHAPIMSELIKSERLDHVTLEVVPNVGHQLGPEADNLVGPISQNSLKVIGEWLTDRIRADRTGAARLP